MDNNNEIKFVKNRSKKPEDVEKLFAKGNYYDAFYELDGLEEKEKIKMLPVLADAYAKLGKFDYEASALVGLLIHDDFNKVDRQIIAIRLGEYYSYRGQHLRLDGAQVSKVQMSIKQNMKKNQRKVSEPDNLISFSKSKFENEEKLVLPINKDANECKMFKMQRPLIDGGEFFIDRATTLALAKKYNEAIEVLKKVSEGDPNYFDVQKLLVAIYVDSGNIDEAVNISFEVLKTNPNEFICIFALRLSFIASNRVDEIYDFMRKLDGVNKLYAVTLKAEALVNEFECEKALEVLNVLGSPDKYNEEVLRLKAICYDILENRVFEEQILKELVTIYPKNVKARFLLSTIQRGENYSALLLSNDATTEVLMVELECFIRNLDKNILDMSPEELNYYFRLALKYLDEDRIGICANAYLKNEKSRKVMFDLLIDMDVDDFKKMKVIEELVLEAPEVECFTLINGMIKKLQLVSFKYLLEELQDRAGVGNELITDIEFINKIKIGYAKAFALSLFLNINGSLIIEKSIDLILSCTREYDKAKEIVEKPKYLALCICLLANATLSRNQKLKKYLNLKTPEVNEILQILQQTSLKDK